MLLEINEINPCLMKAMFYPQKKILGFDSNKKVTDKRKICYYELAYFLYDGGAYNANSKHYKIQKGYVRFLKPGDTVFSYKHKDVYTIHFSLGFDDNGAHKNKELDSIPTSMKIFDDLRIVEIIKDIISASVSQNVIKQKKGIWELIDFLIKNKNINENLKQNQVIARAKSYIKENYHRQITLDIISKPLFLNPNYFQRFFKNHTGITPYEYLLNYRIMKAKEFLLISDSKVDEISNKCGFCNSSYFIKKFKDIEGVTPLQFRKNNLDL